MRTWLNRAVILTPDIGDFWALYCKFEFQHGSKDYFTIKMQFPDFQLEDKLTLLGEGNVRDIVMREMGQQESSPKEKLWKVYVRRKK